MTFLEYEKHAFYASANTHSREISQNAKAGALVEVLRLKLNLQAKP